jgi:hypothetical protein
MKNGLTMAKMVSDEKGQQQPIWDQASIRIIRGSDDAGRSAVYIKNKPSAERRHGVPFLREITGTSTGMKIEYLVVGDIDELPGCVFPAPILLN